MEQSRTSVPRCLATVAQCFGDVNSSDLLGPREIGDGAGHAQHPVETPGAEPHRGGGVGQEPAAGFVRRRDLVEQFAVRLGIGADAVPGIALSLQIAGPSNPRRDLGAAFRRRRQGEVSGADALDLDVEIDPVTDCASFKQKVRAAS